MGKATNFKFCKHIVTLIGSIGTNAH